MEIDKKYCMSSFLMYRTVADASKAFDERYTPRLYEDDFSKIPINQSSELKTAIECQIAEWTKDGKAAIALSGGIDSAIIAKYMPKGSTAYTFKCVVPGTEVTDESAQAAKYAKECGLKHKVIEIYWEDFVRFAPELMKHKGAPIHSIEVQIYKAALKAKEEGFERLIFGESSDVSYGGLSGLMSKDWRVGEFIDRYTYVKPYMVLKDSNLIIEPYLQYENGGFIDAHEFCRGFFLKEGMGSYVNACETAGIKAETPYIHTTFAEPLDMDRIRAGENKYIVREVFYSLYPGYEAPAKLPMPRATNEWMKTWQGPIRSEFWPHCTDLFSGDQKWLVYALEQWLNILDEKV